MKRTLFEIILCCVIAILICVCVVMGYSIENTRLQNKLDAKLDYSRYSKELKNETKIIEKYQNIEKAIEKKDIKKLKSLLKDEKPFVKNHFFGKKNMPIYIQNYPNLEYDDLSILRAQIEYRLYIELLINQIKYRANYIIED